MEAPGTAAPFWSVIVPATVEVPWPYAKPGTRTTSRSAVNKILIFRMSCPPPLLINPQPGETRVAPSHNRSDFKDYGCKLVATLRITTGFGAKVVLRKGVVKRFSLHLAKPNIKSS